MSMSIASSMVVFLGGGIGSLLRYILSTGVYSLTQRMALGTLLVNVFGSFIFFLCAKYLGGKSQTLQDFIRIGLLGGLTTFSTFAYELVYLTKNGDVGWAVMILCLNLVFGIGCGFLILRGAV